MNRQEGRQKSREGVRKTAEENRLFSAKNMKLLTRPFGADNPVTWAFARPWR